MNTFGDRIVPPAPAARLALVRVAVGVFAVGTLLQRWREVANFGTTEAARFTPVGVAHLLSGPVSPDTFAVFQVVTLLLGVLWTLGFAWRLVGPAFGVAFLCWASWRLSWGAITHDLHVATLHVVALSLTPAAAAVSLDARRRGALAWIPGPVAASWHYGWPLRLLQLLTVLTYVLAGWSKVRTPAGFAWAEGKNLLDQIAYSRLVTEVYAPGGPSAPLLAWVAEHGWILGAAATGTLFLELGAPLALLGGRLAWVWTFCILAMHQGIRILMGIAFPFHSWGLALLAFLPIERLLPARGDPPERG